MVSLCLHIHMSEMSAACLTKDLLACLIACLIACLLTCSPALAMDGPPKNVWKDHQFRIAVWEFVKWKVGDDECKEFRWHWASEEGEEGGYWWRWKYVERWFSNDFPQ